MASLYIHILAIYSDGRMLLSPDGSTERSEMVALNDIDRVTKADSPTMIGRFRLRLREGREQQHPYREWLTNVNVVKTNGTHKPAPTPPMPTQPMPSQQAAKSALLDSSISREPVGVSKDKIEDHYQLGLISGDERDRLLDLISQ